ncbi:hypothetical protein J2Z37_004284 [Ammoniphilus resinae]|uniref:Uncharacterized protein n=1 Tax=Ammoniphilus resinae TaxID=861532 RepID=A0ABS4GVG6_9BACL|nr:hypothetical protein [Ammoniphilus resinae]
MIYIQLENRENWSNNVGSFSFKRIRKVKNKEGSSTT